MGNKPSMKGYGFGEALYRNKDAIKGVLALLSGITFISGFDWKLLGLSLLTALVGLGVKLLVDAVDYAFKEK